MELDDLKQLWASLETNRTLNERVLRELTLGNARSSLIPSRIGRAIEVVLGIVAIAMCASVIGRHGDSARYLAFGIPSLVFMIATTATSAYLFVRMGQLSYAGSVVALQREVAVLRRVELHATLTALLGGIVLWLPIALLLFEALTRSPLLDVVSLQWVVANIAFGLVVLVIGRAFANRLTRSNRIVDALTGRGLRVVETRLAELAAFTE